MKLLRTIVKKDLAREICIVRVDLNVEHSHDSWRREAIIPTLAWLRARHARVLLVSHRGRPVPAADDTPRVHPMLSLQPNVAPIERALGASVRFINNFRFPEIRETLAASRPGSIFLLENIRLLKGEETDDARLAKALASLGTMYVNDAFAVSHRKHASVAAITKFLPSFAGLLLERELSNLKKVMTRAAHPFVVILGGVKPEDKMGVLRYFLPKADTFLLGGSIANTMLKATGIDVGSSVYDPHYVPFAKQLSKNKKVVAVTDWLWDNKRILDVGPLTVAAFVEQIKKAKTILWNGPLGLVEDIRYANSSIAIARAIAGSKAFSIVGGGETTQLIRSLDLQNEISFLSTGGGAMLEFLAGKKLPGIVALR